MVAMDEADIRRRLEEDRRESNGWIDVLRNFGDGRLSELHCPHCGSDNQFEYLIHEWGYTIRCAQCHRFIHARGGPPEWLGNHVGPTHEYYPVPHDRGKG